MIYIEICSAYIKSIDGNHLVGVGDEGFGLSGSSSYPYSDYEGKLNIWDLTKLP